jgi:hypothetical protein
MGLTREQIIEYARRYVDEDEVGDFPHDGDLFCIMHRETGEAGADSEGPQWRFSGYGICIDYILDDRAKPMGKWVWMQYLSLDTFPPRRMSLRLQPPHVVKGSFQNPSRSHETRILHIDTQAGGGESRPVHDEEGQGSSVEGKILKFPGSRHSGSRT